MSAQTAAAPATDDASELTHIADNKEAAELLGLGMKDFANLVRRKGCPKKEPKGWPIDALLEFVAAQQTQADDEGTEDLTGNGTPADATDDATDDDAEPAEVGPVVRFVQITVPICEPEGFIARENRIDARMLGDLQLLGLRQSHAGCRESHAQFPDRTHVDSSAEWLRYLCQLIGTEIAAERFVDPPAAAAGVAA